MYYFVLTYLLVGCIKTAIDLIRTALESESGTVEATALEIGFSVIFWGLSIVVNLFVMLFAQFMIGDDE